MTRRTVRFLGKLPRPDALPDDDALDRALDELVTRGEARLPHRPITREAFLDRLGEALAAEDEPPSLEAVLAIHAADLYLACALQIQDERALAVAEAELVPAIRQAAGRIDPSHAFVDEVCQCTRTKLFVGPGAAIAQYRGTGPLVRWVRVTASRIALVQKRAGARLERDDSEDEIARLPAPDDPELAVIWRTCAAEYKAALQTAFASLSRRERNLVRQRYIDELDINALGRLYRVHPATAFRWLKQVEERLATATRAALMAKLSLSESQARSMERLVASQLQLSLTRMLRGRA